MEIIDVRLMQEDIRTTSSTQYEVWVMHKETLSWIQIHTLGGPIYDLDNTMRIARDLLEANPAMSIHIKQIIIARTTQTYIGAAELRKVLKEWNNGTR